MQYVLHSIASCRRSDCGRPSSRQYDNMWDSSRTSNDLSVALPVTSLLISHSQDSTLSMAAFSGKRHVTVWRTSVRLSVPSTYSPWPTRRSMRHGQPTFRQDNKEDRHSCCVFTMSSDIVRCVAWTWQKWWRIDDCSTSEWLDHRAPNDDRSGAKQRPRWSPSFRQMTKISQGSVAVRWDMVRSFVAGGNTVHWLLVNQRIVYFALGSSCEVLWWVCLCVCLSARISPKTHARSLPKFCACCLWPWLGHPAASLRYVMYFRFCDITFFFYSGPYIAVWISLRETNFAYIYLSQSRTEFNFLLLKRVILTKYSKLLANWGKRGTREIWWLWECRNAAIITMVTMNVCGETNVLWCMDVGKRN